MEKSSTSDCHSSISLGLSAGLTTPDRVDSPAALRSSHQLLSQELEKLINDDTADVVMVPNGVSPKKGVRIHSFVLMARTSKYWKDRLMLSLETKKSGAPVVATLGERCTIPALKRVTQYLYTGEIDLQELDLLALLDVCRSLGLPSLQAFCMEQLSSSLEAGSVCSLLLRVEEQLHSSGDEEDPVLQSLVSMCMKFIERRARDIILTEDFLLLSKDILIRLVKSDKLCLPEEEVWRGVLKWVCHQVRCPLQHTKWSDEERQRIKTVLNGVLQHIRLMEISSSVFAQEVEPTGLLTVEETLARYRNAAVPGMKPDQSQSRPRGSTDFFADSDIISSQPQLQSLLNEWYGVRDQEWSLLFRASRDGFHAKDFHTVSDNQGSTLVLIKDCSGNVFGGYTDASWSSRARKGRYGNSNNAFLFTLANEAKKQAKLEVKQPSYAVQSHPSSGPIFGAGADLFISSECNINKDSYSNLLHSYGNPLDTPPHLFTGSYSFQVEDYEVFKPCSPGPFSTTI